MFVEIFRIFDMLESRDDPRKFWPTKAEIQNFDSIALWGHSLATNCQKFRQLPPPLVKMFKIWNLLILFFLIVKLKTVKNHYKNTDSTKVDRKNH